MSLRLWKKVAIKTISIHQVAFPLDDEIKEVKMCGACSMHEI
jgi:hypothetical protein